MKNKPITILRDEFMKNLIELINSSNLPPFVIESIIKDVYFDIKVLARKQLENDLKDYQESFKEGE